MTTSVDRLLFDLAGREYPSAIIIEDPLLKKLLSISAAVSDSKCVPLLCEYLTLDSAGRVVVHNSPDFFREAPFAVQQLLFDVTREAQRTALDIVLSRPLFGYVVDRTSANVAYDRGAVSIVADRQRPYIMLAVFDTPALVPFSTCDWCACGTLLPLQKCAVRVRTSVITLDAICETCASDTRKVSRCEVTNYIYNRTTLRSARVELANGEVRDNACIELLVELNIAHTIRMPVQPYPLPAYHSVNRVWMDESSTWTDKHFGVELELGFRSRTQRDVMLHTFFNRIGLSHNRLFVVESDSSLSDVPSGCEIVSAPLTLSDYQDVNGHWQTLLRHLRAAGGEGWKHRAHAGIHVNMNGAVMGTAVVERMALFITTALPLSMRIAGRSRIFAGDSAVIDESLHTRYKRLKKLLARGAGYWGVNSDESKSAYYESCRHSKYMPLTFRPRGRVEIRIFGSNIGTTGFLSCIEYCDAVHEFVKGVTDDFILERGVAIVFDFRKFVKSNVSKWPSLAARMRTSSFKKEVE